MLFRSCVDTGIRNAVGFRFSSDIGRLYENLVFLHLKRQYDRIYYWKSGGGEVDFLVMEGDRITRAIQVCYDLEGAREREEKALLLALEEFELDEGVIITGKPSSTMIRRSGTPFQWKGAIWGSETIFSSRMATSSHSVENCPSSTIFRWVSSSTRLNSLPFAR